MKNSTYIRGIAPLAVCALLMPTAGRAQTHYTATGWVTEVPVLPIVCTNATNQVLLRGNAHTVRVQSSDARLTGNRLVFANASYQTNGTALVWGTAYQQVGTFDANTNFTPTAGLWEISYQGLMQTNNSLQLSLAGYGSGGTIDGWRLAETMTRTNASGPFDTNVPYLYTGTIMRPPVSTTLASDDFSKGVSAWTWNCPCGTFRAYPTNQAFGTWADWRGCTPDLGQSFFLAWPSSLPTCNLADGQTLECQADLIRISGDTTNLPSVFVGDNDVEYYFPLTQVGVGLWKWSAAAGHTIFWWDNTVHVARTNVVLYMALTRDKGSLIITTRVLDTANTNVVLFERSFVDTPGADGSLTTDQFRARTGIRNLTLVPDTGPPGFHTMYAGVGVWQSTDGHQPPVEAIFDNFACRLHDEPPLSIARAVQLTWTAPAGVNYALEAAPTVQGPYVPVQEPALPGLQKRSVPLSGPAQFFRVVQAP